MFKHSVKILMLFLVALLNAIAAFIVIRYNNTTTKELAQRAEVVLHEKEKSASNHLDSIAHFLNQHPSKNLFFQYAETFSDLYKNEAISIYVYKHDSLCFWTDNQPAIDVYTYAKKDTSQLIKFRNGWFECISKKKDATSAYLVMALIAIKSEYDFENNYLKNDFSSWINLPENTKLIFPVNYVEHAVKSISGQPLFEIYRNDGLYKSKSLNTIASVFVLIAFLLFFVALYLVLKLKIKSEKQLVFVFSFVCFFIRTGMIYAKFPSVFYETNLYDASIFANASSFYFHFMGDIFINCFLLFVCSILIYKIKHELFKTKTASIVWYFLWSGLIIVFFTFSVPHLIYSLVNNTTITYNINELFNFTGYSIIGYVSVVFFVFAFYALIDRIVQVGLLNNSFTWKFWMIYLLVVGIACVFIYQYQLSAFDYLWPLLLIGTSFLLRKYRVAFNFISSGIIILISTCIISHFFIKYERSNKEQTYDVLSLTLADKQDIIAENEFAKISNSIKQDVEFKNLLSSLPYSCDQIESRLRQVNFSGYFERYEVVLSLFRNDSTPIFNSNSSIYLNESYFKTQIIHEGKQTVSDGLFFIDKKNNPIRYISEIIIEDVTKNSEKSFRLYIQLEPKKTSSLGTFLDLLLDKTTEHKVVSRQLSYAIYQSDKLLASFGEYQYPVLINDITFKTYQDENYQHYTYSQKDGSMVIITDKKIGVWQNFTSISYLFVCFSVLVLVGLLFNFLFTKRTLLLNSLNNRIQFIFVFMIFLSLTAVVIGTVWVVTSQFESKNKKELISKSQSVLKELTQTLGQQNYLDASYKENTTYSLKKLSQLFGSDISLYDHQGVLFATSQPTIYEQGLMSKLMNPFVYASFIKEIKSNYSHKESIGSLNYLSAYIPFYNKNDQLLGYINLPYYARQKDLEKELTAYLITLINIYTLLIPITTLIALLASNFLTKPLRIIKQQISNIKFSGHNEALKWASNDEIGNLVSEYNNMLIKLEKNAELLAKSEREHAWKEMAKQVAHEIKNPLTPMKLNIQHLQRVVETHPDDINDRVNKVSQILIEQIDTLSHIATEFSNFAKLPTAKLEVVNLLDVLKNVTQLFKQNTHCNISLLTENTLYIMADKEQCLRIFTNLLKNAEQAIPENRQGIIEVKLYEQDNQVFVKVTDNGIGIPEDKQHKLFTPNFTTKSTGTGLGLAMVKNSVASFDGTISFDTEEGVGTTFKLMFPKITV